MLRWPLWSIHSGRTVSRWASNGVRIGSALHPSFAPSPRASVTSVLRPPRARYDRQHLVPAVPPTTYGSASSSRHQMLERLVRVDELDVIAASVDAEHAARARAQIGHRTAVVE